MGDILKQGNEVDFLLKIAPKSRAPLLADDGNHGLMIEFGVIEAIE
jgi:hypothetical protein